MPGQKILRYLGKATRNIVAEGLDISRVEHGQEVMVPDAVARDLLSMNGQMVDKGENEIMWVDVSPGAKKAPAKKAPAKKASAG